MTGKPNEPPDLNALAIEACDMWQEHLSSLASDPTARADLTRLLEPQRRMFADWATMMQKGGKPEQHTSQRASASATPKPEPTPTAAAAPSATTSGSATSGDDPLRVAQLALRVAELEKRIARLEAAAAKPSAPRRTQRPES